MGVDDEKPPTGVVDADDENWRYESFVVRAAVLPSGVVATVRLERVGTGDISYVTDLAAAFETIDTLIAASVGLGRRSPRPGSW